jgi:hypothetical protein
VNLTSYFLRFDLWLGKSERRVGGERQCGLRVQGLSVFRSNKKARGLKKQTAHKKQGIMYV